MGKLTEGLKKVVFGGPEHKAKKAAEKRLDLALKRREEQAAYEGELKGRIAGAKAKGYNKGFAKGSGRGGLMGSLESGYKAFEKGAGMLTSDVDFGNIGKGLEFSGFGGSSGPRKRRSSKKRRRR